jgi:hypothetical protein
MNDYLHTAWKGAPDDNGIWLSDMIDGQPLEQMLWTGQSLVPNVAIDLHSPQNAGAEL